MTTKPLTTVGIKAIRPSSQRQEIKDGGASHLYLIVQKSGHKSFAMRFRRPDGKTAKLVLGPFDPSSEGTGEPVIGQPLTLAAARHLAADIGRERARGKDVIVERRVEKERKLVHHQERVTNTFGQAAKDFIENHAKPKTRDWRSTARVLGFLPNGEVVAGSIVDRWGERPVAEIDGHDIYNLVEETRTRGTPGRGIRTEGPSEARARHMFSVLSPMFSWLHKRRRVESNPCAGVHRPEVGRSRERVLSDAEIAKFWKVASAEPTFGPLLKLLLLTGCRLNEVAGMRRSEISDDGSVWTIPGSRTENHRPCVVPMTPLAKGLVTRGSSDLVFTTNGTTPLSGWSRMKRRLDEAMGDGVPPWVLHDLRRTTATGMAEIGIAPHIVEACLNHVSGARAGVAGTYNRAAYLPEKQAAMARWASHVEGLVSEKVVSLRARKI